MENYRASNANGANKPNPLIVGIILIVIGLVLLSLGLVIEKDRSDKKIEYSSTTGIVVDEVNQGSSTKHAIYEYKVDGQVFRIKSPIGTNTKSKIGKEVTIYYNPQEPGMAFEDTKANSASLLIMLGSFFALVGALLCTVKAPSNPGIRFFKGMVGSAVFAGMPIAFLVMLPDLEPYVKFICYLFIIIGVAMMGLAIYGTFFKPELGEKLDNSADVINGYISENSDKVQKVEDAVNKGVFWYNRIRTIVFIVLIVGVVVYFLFIR